MSRSIRICSYLVLSLLYLLVNVKPAQLGESLPTTIVMFLSVLLLSFVERTNIKKLMIMLGAENGLAAFNYLFGQSLDASKYVTSAMLLVYTVVIIGMVWGIRSKIIPPHNYAKTLCFFWLAVELAVGLATVEIAQVAPSGSSSLIEVISEYPIYSNSYVLNSVKFSGKHVTAFYFEPTSFVLTLTSVWLSIKQPDIEIPKSDAMTLVGVISSGSSSGVMTLILSYLPEWAFQHPNKDVIREKLPSVIILLSALLVGVIFAFPYIATWPGNLGTEGLSSYYRIVGPLVMVGYSLPSADGVVRFGSLYEYVVSFGIPSGADVGKAIDNGLYLLTIYFSWFAVILVLRCMGKVMKIMINAFGDNQNYRVQPHLFTSLLLFFIGSVFSPKHAFLVVCPLILHKALDITR